MGFHLGEVSFYSNIMKVKDDNKPNRYSHFSDTFPV